MGIKMRPHRGRGGERGVEKKRYLMGCVPIMVMLGIIFGRAGVGFQVAVAESVVLGITVAGGRSGSLGDHIGLIGENTFLKFTKSFGIHFSFHFVHLFTLQESDPFLMYALFRSITLSIAHF